MTPTVVPLVPGEEVVIDVRSKSWQRLTFPTIRARDEWVAHWGEDFEWKRVWNGHLEDIDVASALIIKDH